MRIIIQLQPAPCFIKRIKRQIHFRIADRGRTVLLYPSLSMSLGRVSAYRGRPKPFFLVPEAIQGWGEKEPRFGKPGSLYRHWQGGDLVDFNKAPGPGRYPRAE